MRSPRNDSGRSGVLILSVAATLAALTVVGCGQAGPQVTRVQARPTTPTRTIGPGEYPLGMTTVRYEILQNAMAGCTCPDRRPSPARCR